MNRAGLLWVVLLVVGNHRAYGAPTTTDAPEPIAVKDEANLTSSLKDAMITVEDDDDLPDPSYNETTLRLNLKKLDELLGMLEQSENRAGPTEEEIDQFIQELEPTPKNSVESSTSDPLTAEGSGDDPEVSNVREDSTTHKEVTPFQSLPISYLKESIGDEDHEFFIEDSNRMSSLAEPAFRDVFDDSDEDHFNSNDDNFDFRSREPEPARGPQKGSRSEATNPEGGYLVEPDSVVAEYSDKQSPSHHADDKETVVRESDVLSVNSEDDDLLRPKEVHKYGSPSTVATFYSSDLDPVRKTSVDAATKPNIKRVVPPASTMPETPSTAATRTSESETTTTSASTSTMTSPAETEKFVESTTNEKQPAKTSTTPSSTEVKTEAATSPSADPESTTAFVSTTGDNQPPSSSDGMVDMKSVTVTAVPTSTTSAPTTVTSAAPSAVQKIPQFIKQIYEAATNRLPSFIHSGTAESSSSQTTSPAPARAEIPETAGDATTATTSAQDSSTTEQFSNSGTDLTENPTSSTAQSTSEGRPADDATSTAATNEESAASTEGPSDGSEAMSSTTSSAQQDEAVSKATPTTSAPSTQSTTSSPQDSPIGTLVKGRACEGQSASRLDRIMDHFPARLPELHEFKRRRFLRAAVIGGLHTLKNVQRNVTCNLTSGTTYWGYRLRAQTDGILNLGITGLPRMYLRYTGPLVVKVVLSALTHEQRPILNQVTVEESRVDEIHYQSVLGFEQPFVERATKYLLQRAMKEELLDPLTNAIQDELLSPKADKSKVLLLEDASPDRR